MAKFIIDDAVILYGGRNISGDLNSISLEYSQDLADSTAFGDTSRRRLPGILDVVANHSGWWDSISAADSLDGDLFAKVGAVGAEQMSLTGEGGTLGDITYSFPVLSAQYNQGGSHGEVYPFNITANGNDPLVRGELFENSVRTTTANGASRQLGAVSATETVFSIIHVTTLGTGTPVLDVTVESAATDFASPTVRLTHPQVNDASGVTSNRQSLVAAVTDTWWRMVLTIGGSSPSFNIFGLIGIQTTRP